MKPRGLVGLPAQRTFVEWLESEEWHVAKAASRSKFQAQDLFGALDALAFRFEAQGHGGGGWDSGWAVWGAQVTTSTTSTGTRSERRRKLEGVAWPPSWRISLVSHERVPDPADRVRSLNFWRVQDLRGGTWQKATAVPFDLDALVAEKRACADAKHAEEMDAIRERIARKERTS